jgi:hypothetical protein
MCEIGTILIYLSEPKLEVYHQNKELANTSERWELARVSSRFSPWILRGIIKGDAFSKTYLKVLIELRIALLKPFHLKKKFGYFVTILKISKVRVLKLVNIISYGS